MTTQANENTWQEVNPQTDTMWDPETQEEIQGIYTSKKEKVGPNESNIYILEVNGERMGIWGSTLLDSRFSEVSFGNEVKVKYHGKKRSEKTGREYKDYLVMTRPAPFKNVGVPEESTQPNDDPNKAAQEAAQDYE